ncbi:MULTISPECIES: cupin domain-containing protein [unclassified Pseudomonas]|uniref:cupin domain-containing protein n=1 Tax=unclassified Pseudomonas TaxID=196821 RepID=UPI00244A05E7|nr:MULTISPECIES: cupin domain-containing protein [unclassified Pseudomonas]MDH0303087.1 cupin domain-containing protein [Pseudomonas sp. GD04091]MDH1987675.1 cupin domain-containing protein [Pseudomonas sp. GD03689]
MKALHAMFAGLTMAALATTANATGEKLISVPDSATLHWQAVSGTQGAVSYANVEGDLFGSGPYSAYVKFRKGTDNGLHTHSQTLPTVVLSGTFYAVIDGKRVEYPAGSYYKLPANLVHESGCTAAADCLLFQYQADAFDLNPVKG